MSLPKVDANQGSVELAGVTVTLRGLTRAEMLRLGGLEDEAAMETQMVADSTGHTLDEVREWFAATPSAAVQTLVEKVIELSGADDLGKGLSGA